MNEIKFRAWDKEKGVMLTDTGLVDTSFDFGNTVYQARGNSDFKRSYSYYNSLDEPEEWGRPDDLIWMRYTGLKDKNDAEIYEGDIVKFDARSHYHPEVYAWEYETRGVGIIRYEMGGYVLGGRKETLILESLFGIFMNYEEIETEVIGNIYENPELLKEIEK